MGTSLGRGRLYNSCPRAQMAGPHPESVTSLGLCLHPFCDRDWSGTLACAGQASLESGARSALVGMSAARNTGLTVCR